MYISKLRLNRVLQFLILEILIYNGYIISISKSHKEIFGFKK
jgi:hypothetical protein